MEHQNIQLGKIITDHTLKRDATHIAIAPVRAGETLVAGMHVGFKEDGRMYRFGVKYIGVVDCFIQGPVNVNDKFWLFLYPKSTTALRHDWNHPEFVNKDDIKLVQELTLEERKELEQYRQLEDAGYTDDGCSGCSDS